jgi:DNA-binding NarL/FixJ family response regulator
VLGAAVEAVCSLKGHDPDAVELVLALEAIAYERGALDLLVTAYRAVPELLSVLLRATHHRDRLDELIRRAADEDLASAVGVPVFSGGDPRESLSPRERDVYRLLIEGLTNREIGRVLFIEESTVKAHAHRIYDKLGVRSRTALAVQAVLERSGQATSAMGSTDSGAES